MIERIKSRGFHVFQVDTSNVRPSSLVTDKALTCSGAFSSGKGKMIYNDPQFHRAEIPAANGITNARSLARIYSLLIGDVDENGKKRERLLSEKIVVEATKNITPTGEPDRNWYDFPTTFAKGGFQIYSEYFKIFDEGVFGFTGENYLLMIELEFE